MRKKNSIRAIRRAILIAFIRVRWLARERQVNAITTVMVTNTAVQSGRVTFTWRIAVLNGRSMLLIARSNTITLRRKREPDRPLRSHYRPRARKIATRIEGPRLCGYIGCSLFDLSMNFLSSRSANRSTLTWFRRKTRDRLTPTPRNIADV